MPTGTDAILTERETEVLRCYGQRLSRAEIAEQISRSMVVVDRIRAELLRKLSLKTTKELRDYAARQHLQHNASF